MTTQFYIATDATEPRIAIYGLGNSPERAIADARLNGAEGKLATFPATARLAEFVEINGGAPGTLKTWTVSNVFGLADLVREEDYED